MGTKLYNKPPGYIKEIDSYKTFKKELKITSCSAFFLLSGRICSFVTMQLHLL